MVVLGSVTRLAFNDIHVTAALQLAECLAAHVVDLLQCSLFFTVEYERATRTRPGISTGNSKPTTQTLMTIDIAPTIVLQEPLILEEKVDIRAGELMCALSRYVPSLHALGG